jgi:hypothetical protein
MGEFPFQNATEDVDRPAAARPSKLFGPKYAEQVWEKMDSAQRAELAQLRAAAPSFGRRAQGESTGFGRRCGKPLPPCPSQRALIRHMQGQPPSPPRMP